MRKTVLGIATLVALFGATSVGAEPAKAFQGRKLYNSYCFLCHGPNGKGDGPLAVKLERVPADLVSKETAAKSDRELIQIVQGTAPHGAAKPMPKWNKALPETDIQALVAYVRFLEKSPFPLLGDPELGREVYARYCAVCHGENGKGDGVMTSLIPIKPADHTNASEMQRLDNRALVEVITDGGSGKSYMPAWESVLTKEEVNAVASYIRLLSHK